MIKSKKGSALTWIIIIGILIAIGIGIYFLFFNGGDVSSLANAGSSATSGNSIPQPPALPS